MIRSRDDHSPYFFILFIFDIFSLACLLLPSHFGNQIMFDVRFNRTGQAGHFALEKEQLKSEAKLANQNSMSKGSFHFLNRIAQLKVI